MDAHAPFPVILPSETQSREFDGKLLLAGCLAERDHPVFVGSRIEIHNRIHMLPRGLYLAKDVRGSSRRIFEIMGCLGFSIAAWDEEAIVVADPATYYKARLDEQNLRRVRAFFAWGARNREMIESAPGYPGIPVYETGNPRIDLLTPRCRAFFEPDVQGLRERFGEFILVNSNFGRINHFVSREASTPTVAGAFTKPMGVSPEWWSFRREVFEAFKAMLPALARAVPQRQIVLRPHPAESHETWRAAVHGLPNVTVIHEGNVYPWIMASAVAIHNGCTTGLESYLLDHPVIAYHPVVSERFDRQLPNQVSTPVHSQDALIDLIRGLLQGRPLPSPGADARRLTEEHVGPLDGVLASERIAELIAGEGAGWLAPAPPVAVRVRGWLGSVRRQASKTINSYRRDHKNSRAYTRHRFPGLAREEVAARLGRLGEVSGRFSGLGVVQVGGNIFRVSRH